MLSFKTIGLMVLEKIFLKVSTIYGHGDNLGHVTKTIFQKIYVPTLQEGLTLNLAKIDKAV